MAKKKTYDWKKTAAKFGWSLLNVIVAGVIIVLTEQQEFLFLIPVFEAIKNYIKHR